MEQLYSTTETGTRRTGDRHRVEKVVEALATTDNRAESLAELAHDARNMVTALGLYCDLLDEPGVLAVPFSHYAQELRLVTAASRRLVEKLVALDAHPGSQTTESPRSSAASHLWLGCESDRVFRNPEPRTIDVSQQPLSAPDAGSVRRREFLPEMPVANLAAELLANRDLLAALAGPAIALTVDAKGGALPVRLSTEDLTRVLVNLVKNAAEAMPDGGRIHLSLAEHAAACGTLPSVTLAVEDNGPGVPVEALEKIFAPGFTTRGTANAGLGGKLWAHRGLGLAITRSIIEAAGGRISASNREPAGARFVLELPLRNGACRAIAKG